MKAFLCFALAVLPLAACSGGGGGSSSSSAPAAADVLLTDAPADDLLYLRAEVESVRLERADGSLAPEMLAQPVTVDVKALDGLFEWLAAEAVDPGAYAAVRLGFDPAAFEAAAQDGAPVTVAALASELRVAFPTPLVLGGGDYARIDVDFDLLASLEGDVASGTVLLTPTGTGGASSGDDGVAIDEIKGRVLAHDAAAGTLVVDAFADGDLTAPLGPVDVATSPSTVLVDDDGLAFASAAAFFAALVDGATLVEVHGNLVAGHVAATRIEIEDSFGSGGSSVAEIRGKVVAHAPGASLELLVQEIKKGATTVLPVLAGLGNPASITVGIAPGTVFALGEGTPVSEASLAVGQTVKVKFQAFATEPFPAAKVEIESGAPEFEGYVTSVAGLPAGFVMRLKASEPAIAAGLVASTSTDVAVALGAAGLQLKVDGKPGLQPSDLSVGLKVEVYGTLSGPPTAPSIAATKVQVFPGRLDDAQLGSKSAGTQSFETFGGEIEDPFGGGIGAGPLSVVLAPGAQFDGDVESAAAFFALSGGAELRIEGLATGAPNQIRAYTIKVDAD